MKATVLSNILKGLTTESKNFTVYTSLGVSYGLNGNDTKSFVALEYKKTWEHCEGLDGHIRLINTFEIDEESQLLVINTKKYSIYEIRRTTGRKLLADTSMYIPLENVTSIEVYNMDCGNRTNDVFIPASTELVDR